MELECIRGIMGNIEYYLTDIPFIKVPKIFQPFFELKRTINNPLEKFQREINETRVKQIEQYILENEEFVLPAVVVSIEGSFQFIPNKNNSKIGKLIIESNAIWIINDGQHRIKAITNLVNLIETYNKNKKALLTKEKQKVKKYYNRFTYIPYASLPIQILYSKSLENNQQIFSDINRNAKKTPKSLDILFDNRDTYATFLKELIKNNSTLQDIIEFEKGTIPLNSPKAYTLVDLYNALKIIEDEKLFIEFIDFILHKFSFDKEDKETYIYPYSIFLIAYAKLTKELGTTPDIPLESLKKDNLEGICIFDGKIKKTPQTVERLKNYLKNKEYLTKQLKIPALTNV